MTWETAFSLASGLAALCWIALIVLPRRWLIVGTGIRLAVPLLLAIAYTSLVLACFFTVEGGFGSIAQLRALFSSDPVLLAGWLHYLAFDLLIGASIAARADTERISRLIQAPILAATFMFGPAGWLLFEAVSAGRLILVSPANAGAEA